MNLRSKLSETFNNKWVVSAFCFVCVFSLIYIFYFLYSFAPFGGRTLAVVDGDIQYVDFFAYLKDVLAGKNSISYTLSDTLGGDMLGVFSYYLTSPFNLLIVFFEKSEVYIFFNLLVALKLSTAAFTFSYFLNSRFKDRLRPIFVVLLSLSYAFMQYNIAQASNIMWLDGVYMLPLMILGVHRAVKNRSIVLLSISVALCILFNWYAAGINCLFTIIWFFYEVALKLSESAGLTRKEKLQNIFFSTLNYGGGMVIAVLISAVLFLPTVYTLLAGKGTSGVFENTFSGNILSVIHNNFLGADSSKTGGPALFCGSVALTGCIAFFLSKHIPCSKRIITGALLAVMIIIYYWQPLYLIFSLFNYATSYYFRYSFISIFTIIYIAALFFSNVSNKSHKWVLISGISFSVALLLLEYLKPITDIKYIYYTVFALLVISALLYFIIKHKKYNGVVSVLLAALLIAELLFNAKILIFTEYSTYNDAERTAYQSLQQQQVNEIKATDSSAYRISQTSYRNNAGYNESLAYGYWSNTGYTSCPDNVQLDFLDRLGYRTEHSCITVANTSVLGADSLLGVKYVLSAYPITGLKLREDFGVYNNKAVYENPYCLPLAFTVDSLNEIEEEYTNPFEYHESLYTRLLGEQANIYDKLTFTREESDGVTTYTLDIPNGNYTVYGNIPFSTAQTDTTLEINREQTLAYACWLSPSVFYIPTNSGDTTATVSVTTNKPEVLSEPQFYALNLDRLALISEKISEQSVNDIPLGSDKIDLTVTADKDKFLVLSVPYSNCWTVNINGEEVTPQLLGDCFMVLPLSQGTNTIDMHYSIPLLDIGLLLSVFGIAALVLWIIVSKSKKLKELLIRLLTSDGMRYIIVGVCTTLVNLIVFWICCNVLLIGVNTSNIISVISAIIFAYVTNKIFVFKSHCESFKGLAFEFSKFIGARLITMIIEVGGVFVLYNMIGQNEFVAKLETQIIVLIANYIISKFLVFKSTKK